MDADYANDISERKGWTGFVIKRFKNTVLWKTKKTVTFYLSLSNAKSEYVAPSSHVTECMFMSKLLEDITRAPEKSVTTWRQSVMHKNG